MLCQGCGNEIEPGAQCRICADRAEPNTEEPQARFCTSCGNEFYGDECPICLERAEALSRRGAEEELGEEAAEPDGEVRRSTLCTGCGNEIDPDEECPVCAGRDEPAPGDLSESRLCPSCGNEIYGPGECTICGAGMAPRRAPRLTLCPQCGNEVADIERCPICEAGRGTKRPRKKPVAGGALCPQCDELLEEQDWDGVRVRICGSCQGMLFPPDGLERTLDKLRENAESDTASLTEEFRKRLHGSLPDTVRYKPCPVCSQSMTRRNYRGGSGIIVDICGRHGTWVSTQTFGDLSDFVTRGGEQFVAGKRLYRQRRR